MRVDIVTIFPAMFDAVLGASILKRAVARGAVTIQVHDLRRWSPDRKHLKVDDRPYGGGPGMVMRPEPFFAAVEELRQSVPRSISQVPGSSTRNSELGTRNESVPRVILLSPQGQRLTQSIAQRVAQVPWLILLCGHYEGVDERVREALVDEELSIGDYVLTGGELPAMVLLDTIVRLVPGVLGDPASPRDESFSESLLEYPQYTRPREYRGWQVPAVLLSGNAKAIAVWRRLTAWSRTRRRRPDLVQRAQGESHGEQS